MSLDERSTAILTKLVNADSYTTMQELVEGFSISRRTVYYDIEKINGWLKDQQIAPIQYIRSTGFFMESTAKERVPKQLQSLETWQYDYSAKERKAWIIIYLMGVEAPLFLEDLMDKLRVSRNTIIEDVKVLKEELKRYQIRLESDRKLGYVVVGKEDDKRKAIVFYLSLLFPEQGWQSILSSIQMSLNKADQEKSETELFQPEKLKAVYSAVSEIESDLNLQFTDDILHSLTFRFYLFSKRLSMGKRVHIGMMEKEVLGVTQEYAAAKSICEKLEVLFGLNFLDDEVLYMTRHLLSSKVNYSEDLFFQENNEVPNLKEVIHKMVMDFEKYACVTFTSRNLLEQNLLLHIKPAYYRMKYGLEVENQVAHLIKEKYNEIFRLTKRVVIHLEEIIGHPMQNDEIAFIAMHFGGWLKRSGVTPAVRKRVLIVCTNGIGTARILQQQLEELFVTIDVVKSVSLREYEKNDYDVDFVISTIPVKKKESPVFVVNPIMTDSEMEGLLKKVSALNETENKPLQSIQGLLNIIQRHAQVIDEEALKKELKQFFYQPKIHIKEVYKPALCELLNEKNIQLVDQVNDWKEAIQLAATPLLKDHFLTESYVQAMIDNVVEKGPYIVIAPRVAIPHASPEDGAQKLGMSLLRVKKGVSFSDERGKSVHLIIVLCAIDGDTHLKALSQLTKMMSNERNTEKLIQADSSNTIMEMIDFYSADHS